MPGLNIDRSAPGAAEHVAAIVREQAGRWSPAPFTDPIIDTWRALAALGRRDLTVARLVEGHVDALRILAEADRRPEPGAVYGVWASASGGTGLRGETTHAGSWLVEGTMRFCSGAWFIDRALTVISTPEGKLLVDVDVRQPVPAGALTRQDDSWPAVGMDVTRSVDMQVNGLRVDAADAIGAPGFYLDRAGFAVGGIGVAAVWLGGAAGVLDALLTALTGSGKVSAHQHAHLGVIAVTIAAADALIGEVASRLDDDDPQRARLDPVDAGAVRSAVELAVDVVLIRAPRVSGATPLCRDAALAHRLADLGVYVRQHHAEADYEQLGVALLESGQLLGRISR